MEQTNETCPAVEKTVMEFVDSEIAWMMKSPDLKPQLAIMRLLKVELEEFKRNSPKHNEPNDEDFYAILGKQLKKLNDERAAFAGAGRDTDSLDKQIAQVKVMMPDMMSEEELRSFVKEYLDQYSEMPNKLNIGGIMQALNIRYANRFDKGLAAKIAKEALNG